MFGTYIVQCAFEDLNVNQNGGAVCVTSTPFDLIVNTASFINCKVTENLYQGGGIYFQSNSRILTTKLYANECVALQGYFIYADCVNPNLWNAELNKTVTVSCHGKDFCVCGYWNSNLLTRDHNSTASRSTDTWCNLFSTTSKKSSASFLSFYSNDNNILYGVYAGTDDNNLSFANFISNRKTKDGCGLIHINVDSNIRLTISNIAAFENSQTLLDAYTGAIIVVSMECDILTTSGTIINKNNIVEGSSLSIGTPLTRKIAIRGFDKRWLCTKRILNYQHRILIQYISTLALIN